MKYSIDTSSILEGWRRHYPLDVFPGLWDQLDSLIADGDLRSTEEVLHELAGTTEQTFVVTCIPDIKRGERLVVLHMLPEDRLKECLAKLANTDLPNLWKPRADDFYWVEAFPYLGSGKLDLRKVKELALEFARKDVRELPRNL